MIPAQAAATTTPVTPTPQAPAIAPPGRTPIDADRLAQQIEQVVNDAVTAGLSGDRGASARDRIRASVDEIRAEIDAARAGGTSVVVRPTFPDGIIPPQAVDISLAFFFTMATIIIGLPLARAFARRMDRRGQAATVPDIAPRLDRIEQAVDAVAIEVERISESQRYSTRMISEMRGLPPIP